eukprot:CAMPEP_0170543150 /NCGR_PEP_ID=MMETSP0211-20121228/2366_1 /TAXON_ID=311385 /ORGANISM="Pseudokeronopsis sp., Strain OXSARD2" /LENGTH=68 /DNA_ID=CAMNT_0010846455 /DNA_START=375 /DNA_END=581 /DNA_ORIENTATION=-
MRADRGYMCLSEINLDFPIPGGLGEFIKDTLPPQTVRDVMYGSRYTGPQAKEKLIVNNVYQDVEDLRN